MFRDGAHFPAFSFEKHAETEGFGKLCRRMGLSVVGLPHYVIWHIYEPSTDDLKHMEWMAQEEEKAEKRKEVMKVYKKVWKAGFENVQKGWEDERLRVLKNSDPVRLSRNVRVDWSD